MAVNAGSLIAGNFHFVDQRKDVSGAGKESTPIGSKLSQKTLLDILNSKYTTSLNNLKQAHSVVLRTGHFEDHYVSGTLVKCYANPAFNNFCVALKVFDNVPNPNVFVWNITIKGCVDNNEAWRAVSFYVKMVETTRPNKFTFPTLFRACTLAQAEREGLQFHAHVVKHGFSCYGHLKSAGIQMYSSFGRIVDARKLLDGGGESDIICWNAMIDGYLRCGDVQAARELFEKMPRLNIGSWNAMISGLSRCGLIKDAREMFDEMTERDEISWSAMIDGYLKCRNFKEALNIFHQMQSQKIEPRKFVLSSVLSACANVGSLEQGRWVHAYVERKSIKLDAVLGTALLDMYAKCGRLDMAWDVFEKMKEKEVFTWNAMIGGSAIHGRAQDAIQLLSQMKQDRRVKPNEITFIGVLSACAHAGMVDKGLEIFNSMRRLYDIEPQVEHYGCVVDILGRAGLLAEAEELIRSMPVKPNAAIWGALLGACKKYGSVELGEKVGKILLELEPEHSGRYTLLSNIYAKAGRFDDAATLRKKMKERGIRTTPGVSLINLGSVIYEFKMGDGSHPQMGDIYNMLKKMMERLQIEGYSPNTSEVLFDIEAEEKESSLQFHSEKLAIAFGLLNTTPGTTIHVVKNLRVCEDCHSAAKFISQIYDREIVLRDRVRYHHFKNGRCSCDDFW